MAQGEPLLRAMLRPGEQLLWHGCSGIPKSRAQVQNELYSDAVTIIVTFLLTLTFGYTLFMFAGKLVWTCLAVQLRVAPREPAAVCYTVHVRRACLQTRTQLDSLRPLSTQCWACGLWWGYGKRTALACAVALLTACTASPTSELGYCQSATVRAAAVSDACLHAHSHTVCVALCPQRGW